MEKKIFRLNDDGVSEWVLAYDKKQAVECADKLWGGLAKDEYFAEYIKDNPNDTYDDFIEYFAVEETKLDIEFSYEEDGTTTTFRRLIESSEEVPCYLGAEEY